MNLFSFSALLIVPTALFVTACTEVAPTAKATGSAAATAAATGAATGEPAAGATRPAREKTPAIARESLAPATPETAVLPAPAKPAPVVETLVTAAPAGNKAAPAKIPAAQPAARPSPKIQPAPAPARKETLLLASAAPAVAAPAPDPPAKKSSPVAATWEDHYAALLRKYIGNGGVSYRNWHANKADLAKLDSVTGAIASASLSGKSSREKFAFYLNAYNAWILKRILDEYPTKGPGNGSKIKRAWFFRSKNITVAGNKTSFHGLENDVIRPRFSEPRVHFALNCASASCPPLQGKPFNASTLDTNLNRLTRAYLNANPEGVRLAKGKVQLSQIFEWYAADFTPDAVAWINKYRSSKVPASAKVEYQPYDWSLNEAR